MIGLRRGRQVQLQGSSVGIEVAFDLEPASRPERNGCFAPWRPPVEVFETEQNLVVRAEIGGLSEEQVNVVVERDHLVIRGERTILALHEDGRRLYHESRVRYGEFAVAIRLPFPVDNETASAEYVDGFLTVTLPRLAATRIAPKSNAGPAGSGQEISKS
jgi:HSP20 family molecular chaperone IbpA